VVLAFSHQLVMLGLNGYRAYEALRDTSQRMHYIQAALNNLFNLGLLTGIVGAVVFVMLTPIAPFVGSVCALTAVSFTLANMVWRVLPHNWKLSIKGFLYLGKPEPFDLEKFDVSRIALSSNLEQVVIDQSIFSKGDFSVPIKALDLSASEPYLQSLMTQKGAILQYGLLPTNDMSTLKSSLRSSASAAFHQQTATSKTDLFQKNPLAVQGFWAEKRGGEQQLDAALVLSDPNAQSMKAITVTESSDTQSLTI
jgi:hypothetical protein